MSKLAERGPFVAAYISLCQTAATDPKRSWLKPGS